MSKLYAEYALVSQDSFNRAKKWVQELQRQGMAANLSLFLQHCGKNSILSLGIVVSLGLHVLSIVSCDMQATQTL
jgi:2',3'-cyclic-nucleotide 2'-phosphodiesterase (5'-nucleotidase family)